MTGRVHSGSGWGVTSASMSLPPSVTVSMILRSGKRWTSQNANALLLLLGPSNFTEIDESFESSWLFGKSVRLTRLIFLSGPGLIPAFSAELPGSTARTTGRIWNAAPIAGMASGSPSRNGWSSQPGISSGISLTVLLSCPPPTFWRVTVTSISFPARLANSTGSFSGSIWVPMFRPSRLASLSPFFRPAFSAGDPCRTAAIGPESSVSPSERKKLSLMVIVCDVRHVDSSLLPGIVFVRSTVISRLFPVLAATARWKSTAVLTS